MKGYSGLAGNAYSVDMKLNRGIILSVFSQINESVPSYVKKELIRLLPAGFALSILDIFGLLALLPIIKILVDPGLIENNSILNRLYLWTEASNATHFVLFLVAAVLVLFLIKILLTYFISKFFAKVSFGVASKLVVDQYAKYVNAPLSYRSKIASGDLLRSIIEIPYNFVVGIFIPYSILLNEVLLAALLGAAIFVYSPPLFLSIVVLLAPVLFLYIRSQRKRLARVSIEREKYHSEMFNKGKKGLDGFIEILLLNKVEHYKSDFRESVMKFSGSMARLNLYNAISPKIIEGFAVAAITAVLVGAYFWNFDLSEVAAFLVTFAIAAYRLIPSMNRIILSVNNIKTAEFVFKHLKENADIPSVDLSGKESIAQFSTQIVFDKVNFSYDSGGSKILSDLTFTIKKGEYVGLMGASGSGKTTITKLLLKLILQQSGSITIDGLDLRDLKRTEWYNIISYVPQQVTIFPGTIKENITMSSEKEIGRSQLDQAVEMAELKEFIEGLDKGLNTYLGDQGLNISGGQRQRIGIARALYKKSSVLVLDEITSSLDINTEKSILECIRHLYESGYTIIMIAHQRRILRNCSVIYRLDNGKFLPEHPSEYEFNER